MPRLVLAIALVFVATSTAAADGKIQRARDQARGNDRASGSNYDDDDDSDEHYDEDDDDIGSQIVGGLLEAIFSSDDDPPPRNTPPTGGSTIDPFTPSYGYARYPYASGHDGYLVPREIQLAYGGPVRPVARRPHDYAVQLSLEAGYLDDIARVAPNLRLLTPSRVELDTRWAYLHETLDDALPGQRTSDSTNLGSSHLSYRLGEGVAGLLRLGLGMRYMVDHVGSELGFDMLVGADLFVGSPFVVSLELTGGTLGDAVVFAPRAQLGVMLGRCEVFAAYEHVVIGEVEFPTPMLGSRIWL